MLASLETFGSIPSAASSFHRSYLMPFVARCLEDLFSAGAAKPNPAGSELQQQSAKLVALTPARCLTAHYDVQQSMQVMYRHVPTRSIPHLMAVFWLHIVFHVPATLANPSARWSLSPEGL